jgi:hypothetical protein
VAAGFADVPARVSDEQLYERGEASVAAVAA